MTRRGRWKRLISLLLAAVAGLAACSRVTAEQMPAADPSPLPLTFFGMHFHHLAKATPWPAVPIGSWRLHDAYVKWSDLEPEKGKWDFAILDKYAAMAAAHRVDLLLPLGFPPRWASARPAEHGPYGVGSAAEPASIEDWRSYVRTVATRYKGRIHHYELWNEFNVKEFYSGSVSTLVDLAREAHRIVKEVDPANILVSPSIVGEGRHPALDDYLAKGGGRYADVIGYHFYMPKTEPETMLKEIRAVKNIMAKHGVSDKPLWNTETGWWIAHSETASDLDSMDPSWKRLEPEEAGAYLCRALLISWLGGVKRFYFYSWDAGGMGMIEPQSKKLKPVALAYSRVVEWMNGKTLEGCENDDGLWKCRLRSAAGQAQWIAWTRDSQTRSFRIPTEWRVTGYENLTGKIVPLDGGIGSITVGPSPVRIH